MGFRSNFITEDNYWNIPEWFVEKYPDYQYTKAGEGKRFAIAQLYESKFYGKLSEDERFTDIQKVLKETGHEDIILILLHECGGITRVRIGEDSITAREPVEWKEVEQVEHDYCYRCSDKN